MFKNRPSFRFALVASALIALAAITATATRGTQFAFIDSVQEFFGMASVTTPTRTVAPMRQLAETTIILAPAPQPMFFATKSISSVGTAVTENFDSLTTATFNLTDNTSIDGVYAFRAAGNAIPNVFTADNGGSNAGRFNNYGTTSATDRALGSASSGTPGTLNYGVRYVNNTGLTITALQVSYTGEQWRNGGNTTPQVLAFDYQQAATVTSLTAGTFTAVPALNFTSLINTATAAALDGNAAANRTVLTSTITVNIPNGEEIMLRWTDLNDAGNDHGFGIDDLSVTATRVISGNITMNGNNLPIVNGSTTPSTANHTDFGSMTVGTSTSRGLVIGNASSTQLLYLYGSPIVTISGPAAGDFSVTLQPTSPVPTGTGGCQVGCVPTDAPKANGDYTIQFLPTAAGTRSATVTIANSDGANNPFTFDIQGMGVAPPPTITLNPSTAFDFGSVNVGSNSSTTTSTVTGADLTTTLNCSSSTAEFELSPNGLAGSWGGGVGFTPTSGAVSATLHIRFVPTLPGVVNGTVTCSSTGATNAVRNLSGTGFSTLNVTKNGTGSGTVTSGDSAINCGTTCTANYTSFVALTHMTATPAPGSVFAGWSGGSCSGTGACNFQMSTNRTVTATFNTVGPTLGTYANQSIMQGANAAYTPTAAPTGTTGLVATTSLNFTGTLVANPTTGAVRVTNAGPAGVYTVKVTASGAGGSTSTTFQLTVTTGASCAGTTTFTSSPDLTTTAFIENTTLDSAAADLNNDGKQDIVFIDAFTRAYIRLGNGDGTFTNPTVSPGTNNEIVVFDNGGTGEPSYLAVGDINGDGKQDFVVAETSSARIRPYLGNGDGTFVAGTLVNPGFRPYGIALGDLNSDGKLDVIFTKPAAGVVPGAIETRLGDGAGGFTAGTSTALPYTGVYEAADMVLGYFNNDAFIDVAIPAYNVVTPYVLSVRLGDGAGGFTSPTTPEYSLPGFTYNMATGDFNKDGSLDLEVSFINPNGPVVLFQGNNTGNFVRADVPITSNNVEGVGTGDFNNDTNPDIVSVNASFVSGQSVIRFGDGTGGAGGFPTGTFVGTAGAPRLPVVGDFNGDGRQDIAFQASGQTVANIRMNNCAQPEMAVAGGAGPTEIPDGGAGGGPNVTDGTEFGSQSVASGFVDRTYTITNTGGIQLDLTGTPKVVVGGTDPTDFTVTLQPTTPVTASGGTTTFTVRFDPVAGGLRTATLSIANNDADENPYNFSIQGTGTAAPTVTTNAASLVASTSATLNGTANPNGDATTGWFRYSTTSPGTCNDSFGTRAPSSGGTALGSGTSAVAYTQGITGLVAGTTYFYCAIAQNNTGIAFGSVQQFTTPSAPTVTTTAASLVTSTTATLNGTGNPNGDATTGYFRYSTTSPGTCNDTFGTRAPATGGTALGSGTSAVAFNQAITGLTGATTYFYCAIAQNSIGTGFGAVLSFSTPDAPTVTTNAATSVTSTSATLNAAANPNSDATTGWFRYSTTDPGTCNDTFGTRAPLSGGSSLGSGTSAVAYSNAISGLLPGNTYFYCGIASNSLGTRFGAVLSFTTLAEAPTVTTNAATLITKISATLNGTANPGGAATTGWFRYSTVSPGTCNDTFGTRAPASGGSSLGSGNSAVAFSQAITGLSPAITYYYCAIASNTIGTSFGTVMSFSASAAEPDVTTNAATLVASGSATLNAAANPNGLATTGWFRYSTTNPGTCDDTFGTRAPSSGGTAIAAGTSAVAYSNAISGLLPGTTYFYCGIASNSLGTSFGSVLSFTTLAEAPTVTTSAATLVTQTTATLNGAANPGGDATTGWFRYSTTSPGTCNDTFGTRAPSSGGSALGSGNSVVPYSQGLTGLTASTTYFYCAIAQNTIGTGLGSVMQFTTPAIVETGVTLTGGALVVSDDNGGSSADTITLSCNSSNLRINDPGRVLGAGPGTTQVDANTVDVSLAGLTSISVNTFDGSDTLNVNLSGCDIIPGAGPAGDAASFAVGGINFGGGANTTGPGDKLNIIGGSATTQTFNFTNEHDGNVVLAGGSVAGTISYTGLEPVSSTVTATNVILNYSAVTETITVSQDAGATTQTKVDSDVGGESVSFVNPTTSLEINGGDTGNDTINVNGFGTSTGGFNAGLTINGGTGNDTVNLNTNITFAAGNSLDVDLINDNLSPGVDTINVGTSASLQLSGSGTATLNASRNVTTGFSSSVTTANGNVTITANPAGTTTGAFTGVNIAGTVEATGTGKVTVAGKGGDSGSSQYGVAVQGGIVRGGSGSGIKTEVTGTGASNNTIGAHGVFVNDFSSITSIGGDVLVTGTGGAGGGGTDNYGVIVFGTNGVITSGGTGAVTVNGFGGTAASKNFGVIPHTGGTITSGGSGAVVVNGTGGPGVFGVGVEVFRNGKITSGGGTVNVTGTSPGSDGVLLTTDVVDALITSGGGAVTVTGVPGPGAVG
ncbi:MAG TPA: FG-GAP-like repeat-containing protein, partial [Pyrinomonadaceae bacterium]|nr:FG-GAP-like repeat-containing protein [Pyrinomonadaceae bacterium]